LLLRFWPAPSVLNNCLPPNPAHGNVNSSIGILCVALGRLGARPIECEFDSCTIETHTLRLEIPDLPARLQRFSAKLKLVASHR
jgi:hypothetical protein